MSRRPEELLRLRDLAGLVGLGLFVACASPDSSGPVTNDHPFGLGSANVWTSPPIDFNFGRHWVDTDSVRRLFLSSERAVRLRLIAGAQAGFAVEGLDAAESIDLDAGASKPIVVRFSPTTPGYASSTLAFAVGSTERVLRIEVAGEATDAPIECVPTGSRRPVDGAPAGVVLLDAQVKCQNRTLDALRILDVSMSRGSDLVALSDREGGLRTLLGPQASLDLWLELGIRGPKTSSMSVAVSLERKNHDVQVVERPFSLVDWGRVPVQGSVDRNVSFELAEQPDGDPASAPSWTQGEGREAFDVLAYPMSSATSALVRFQPAAAGVGMNVLSFSAFGKVGYVIGIGLAE